MCPYIDTYTVVNSGNVLPHVTLRIQSSKKKKEYNPQKPQNQYQEGRAICLAVSNLRRFP